MPKIAPTDDFFLPSSCIYRKKVVPLQRNLLTDTTMTKKRRQENLAYLLEIEQDMLRKGKRLSQTFYGMKQSAEEALARA